MIQTLQINIHSFVDLITNSSSELFICSTNKAVEAVKELVEEVCKQNSISTTTLWEEIFKEPRITDFTLDIAQFPTNLIENYRKYQRYGTKKNTEVEHLEEAERKAISQLKQEAGTDDSDFFKRRTQVTDAIWEKWEAKKVNAELQLLKHFLKTNGCTTAEIESVKLGKYHNVVSEEYRIQQLSDEFFSHLNWGTTVRKGDIILEGAHDNSIPYKLFDSLEVLLNATRIHCG